jgi:hypothetical protein
MKTPNNYGELIASFLGGTLWSYAEYGDYQGDYVALIYKDSHLLIYKGSFGSCNGCDWLSDYESEDEIPNEDVEKYMEDVKDFLTIPSDSLPKTEGDLIALLPANTRVWLDDEFAQFKVRDILKQINTPTCDNLDIIETEAKNRKLI